MHLKYTLTSWNYDIIYLMTCFNSEVHSHLTVTVTARLTASPMPLSAVQMYSPAVFFCTLNTLIALPSSNCRPLVNGRLSCSSNKAAHTETFEMVMSGDVTSTHELWHCFIYCVDTYSFCIQITENLKKIFTIWMTTWSNDALLQCYFYKVNWKINNTRTTTNTAHPCNCRFRSASGKTI